MSIQSVYCNSKGCKQDDKLLAVWMTATDVYHESAMIPLSRHGAAAASMLCSLRATSKIYIVTKGCQKIVNNYAYILTISMAMPIISHLLSCGYTICQTDSHILTHPHIAIHIHVAHYIQTRQSSVALHLWAADVNI
jgi:hypothetical protein